MGKALYFFEHIYLHTYYCNANTARCCCTSPSHNPNRNFRFLWICVVLCPCLTCLLVETSHCHQIANFFLVGESKLTFSPSLSSLSLAALSLPHKEFATWRVHIILQPKVSSFSCIYAPLLVVPNIRFFWGLNTYLKRTAESGDTALLGWWS